MTFIYALRLLSVHRRQTAIQNTQNSLGKLGEVPETLPLRTLWSYWETPVHRQNNGDTWRGVTGKNGLPDLNPSGGLLSDRYGHGERLSGASDV